MAANTDEGELYPFSLSETLEEASQQVEARDVELTSNREVLCSMQAMCLKVEKSREAAHLQLNATERAIQSLSDEMMQLQLRASDLESDSQAVYLQNITLQHKIEEETDNFLLMLARYNMYRNKMENHKTAIFMRESQSTVHRELVEKRGLINQRKAERERLQADLLNPEGNAMRQAQKEVDELRMQISSVEEVVFRKTQLLVQEQETHMQLREDTEIQSRRCEAILRRMRSQLHKAQSNHRQLTGDICWLEQEAADLRRRLQIQEGTPGE